MEAVEDKKMKPRANCFLLLFGLLSLPVVMGQANNTDSLPASALELPSCAVSVVIFIKKEIFAY